MKENLIKRLTFLFVNIISETNGIAILDTLDLAIQSEEADLDTEMQRHLVEFRKLLFQYQQGEVSMDELIVHPVSIGLSNYLLQFPLKYREEHIHLTGSLEADFLYPRLVPLLEGPEAETYKKKIQAVFGDAAWPIASESAVNELIRLKRGEKFDRYLQILDLSKLVLTNREAHVQAAYDLASKVYHHQNIGFLRLKFTLSRHSSNEAQRVPGLDAITTEDVVTGLFEGFESFRSEYPDFNYVLSPSFRKEPDFFDGRRFRTKKEDFLHQVDELIAILDKYPDIAKVLNEVDTVGNERDLYAKRHFLEMKTGFRKLQYKGFKIRSHHGEVWKTLNKGIQAVDNSMNIWHIDTLEHGLSLGVNPNYYFHALFQKVMISNQKRQKIELGSTIASELMEMSWNGNENVRDKIFRGEPLSPDDRVVFLKAKFHTAREVEHYQHDVLNRLRDKEVSLVSLPSSNSKLTSLFPDFKDHPFSWWEKKGIRLGVGTDNYVALNTNYVRELLILLFSDPNDLKITKLLMVACGESRRPFLSHLMWKLRKNFATGFEKPIVIPFF